MATDARTCEDARIISGRLGLQARAFAVGERARKIVRQ